MADFEYLNKQWTRGKIVALLHGRQVPDEESGDGYSDAPNQSWYQIRCNAIDYGRPDSVLDAIQFESYIEKITDSKARAAILLTLHGMDSADIGAAIGGRRTGSQLINDGIRALEKIVKYG